MIAFGRAVLPSLAMLMAWSLSGAPGPAVGDDATDHAKSLSRAFRRAAEQVRPAVVTVLAKKKPPTLGGRENLRELMRDPRFRQLFPEGLAPEEPGDEGTDREDEDLPLLTNQIGSGVVIDAEGVVLTNNHVVADADQVIVRLQEGHELKAESILRDPMSDLAVVRVRPEKRLPVARLGDSTGLEIGDWVIAIGSPFELEATVSAGIISGKGRGIDKIRRGRLLQTDAAINPGNSGGPLVNLDGEVVGINTAIATNNGGYQGIGFAIPADRARWVARDLLEHGRVRRAYMGIVIKELTPEEATRLGVSTRSGVWVQEVLAGGAAEAAGIRENDLIVEFAGVRVRGPRDLQDVVEQKPVGSEQLLRLERSGRPLTVQVVLKALEQ